MKWFFLVAFCFGLFTQSAFADEPCERVLSLGIPNIDQTTLDISKQTDIIRQLETYHSYEEAKKSSFGLSFGIDGLLDEFGLTHDDSGYNKLVDQLKQYEHQSQSFQKHFSHYSQTASEAIAEKFVQCLTAPGKAYAWSERTNTTTSFVVAIKYNPTHSQSSLRIDDIKVLPDEKSVICNKLVLKNNITDVTRRMTCKIGQSVKTSEVSVTLNGNADIINALLTPIVLEPNTGSGAVAKTCQIWSKVDSNNNPFTMVFGSNAKGCGVTVSDLTPQSGGLSMHLIGDCVLGLPNARLYDVKYHCVGKGCGWSYNPDGGNNTFEPGNQYAIKWAKISDQEFKWYRFFQTTPEQTDETYTAYYEMLVLGHDAQCTGP